MCDRKTWKPGGARRARLPLREWVNCGATANSFCWSHQDVFVFFFSSNSFDTFQRASLSLSKSRNSLNYLIKSSICNIAVRLCPLPPLRRCFTWLILSHTRHSCVLPYCGFTLGNSFILTVITSHLLCVTVTQELCLIIILIVLFFFLNQRFDSLFNAPGIYLTSCTLFFSQSISLMLPVLDLSLALLMFRVAEI